MSDEEIKEGLFDVEDPSFERLRGETTYEPDYRARNIFIASMLLVAVSVVFGLWFFHRQTLSDEDILQENLRKPKKVGELLAEAATVIRHPLAKKEELVEAVKVSVKIGTTPLRLIGHPQAPLIPERQYGLIEALEGLLRLELEGFLDFSKPEDRQFFETNLRALGKQRLEYYEGGVLERIPLMERAWYESQIEQEEARSGFKDDRVIKDLRAKLLEVEKSESFTVLSPAFLLGRWYRFYNDMSYALRCFHIGRKYLDGYWIGNKFIPGKKLEAISSVWDEYAGCLEALAEEAFERQKFRQARSYLMRIFDTPKGVNMTYLGRSMSEQIEATKVEINRLRHDMGVIERVLTSVSELPSFPFFHPNDSILRWKFLLDELRLGYSEMGTQVRDFVLERLDRGAKHQINTNKGNQWLTYPIKEEILKAFNLLVRDPTFFQTVSYDHGKLSSKAKFLVEKSANASLSSEEYMFLNRDIIDAAFSVAIANEYLLTDGTRLNNSLTSEQVSQLVGFYNEEIYNVDTDPRRKESLRKEVNAIYRREKKPTLFTLKTVLKNKVSHIEDLIAENERVFDEQRTTLKNLRDEVRELEERGGVDVDRILSLHDQEELARSRQQEAKVLIRQYSVDLEEMNMALADLNKDFREKLGALEVRLANMIARQERLREKNLTERGPLVNQIEQQIELREKYLFLLRGLKEKGDATTLQRLDAEQQSIQDKIRVLREQVSQVTGNEREKLEIELKNQENRSHQLIRNFNKLFDPVRDVVASISEEEEEIWKTDALLKETQKEIAILVGSFDQMGLLAQKTKKRASLLLSHSQKVVEGEDYSLEVRQLNEEIVRDHARLQALLQTEKFAKSTLETFYPFAADHTPFSLREGDMSSLEGYLEKQDQLMEQYEALWKQKALQEDIYRFENMVLENMKLISDRLSESTLPSESQVNDLSRYMHNILEARKHLKQSRRHLKLLDQSTRGKEYWKGAFETGYFLDSVESFQMEQDLGLNVSEYRRMFEGRKSLVLRLQQEVMKKKKLEESKLEAIRVRDQVAVDVLLPQILEVEKMIRLLSEQAEQANEHLRNLARDYSSNLDRVHAYRQSLQGQMLSSADRIGQVSRQLLQSDQQIESIRTDIFGTAGEFAKTITSLKVGDLSGIDELLEQQTLQLERLRQVLEVKLREDFYKAKSLWMIGKSLHEQSKLGGYDELVASNDLPSEMRDEESRIGQLIVKEFNPMLVYSEQMFSEEAEELDDGDVAFDNWVDFLEQGAVRVFHEELPNYVVTRLGASGGHGFTGYKKQDNDSFIARSRFLSGEIYMKRALRFIRTSRASPEKNAQAAVELDAATRAFLGYLDFVSSLTKESQRVTLHMTETEFASKEFPSKDRKPFHLVDDARIYLGIISYLKADYHESIAHFRDNLAEMFLILPNAELGEDGKPIGQMDPILLQEYQYDSGLSPLYASLLSTNPSSHEVLYRMGRCYSALAQLEHEKKVENPLEGFVGDRMGNQEAIDKYARMAIAYFSQLILTQSYSPYRSAALLQRALLRKQQKDYENARKDFISILGAPGDQGGGWDQEEMNEKGDLPGELNPGYSFVSFELGKLYFQNQDYDAAAEAFRKAQDGHADNAYVLQAKIAYAKSLMKTSNWLMADYFLSQLANERSQVREDKKHFYQADILVHLGKVRKELINFNNALGVFRNVFRDYAPRELRDKDNHLVLSDVHGLALLETDFRDSIRPLAMSAMYSSDIYLLQRDYSLAKEYFKKSETLFKMLPWREDRVLRDLSRKEFEQFRHEQLLLSRWGYFKSNILELMFSTYAGYRRVVGRGIEQGDVIEPQKILAELEQYTEQAREQEGSYRETLNELDRFYAQEMSRLPEYIERKRVEEIRNWDRQVGGQSVHRYDTLLRLRDFVLGYKHFSPLDFITELLKKYLKGSFEDILLNDFVMEYAKSLRLTAEDRKSFIPLNSNLDNLLELPGGDKRLADFSYSLQRWLEEEMRRTGLDDLFIPVSQQAKVLEEVDLYRASLLSHLNTFDDYRRLKELVREAMSKTRAYPNRVQLPEVSWQLVEIGAMTASYREDWSDAEDFHRFLLQPENERHFIAENRSDLYRARLGFAKALLQVGSGKLNQAAFIADELEKQMELELAQKKLEEARVILQQLSRLQGASAIQVATRIQAKEMLNELKGVL